jgi:putative inorganic carbon (HCO3(-)) transporter
MRTEIWKGHLQLSMEHIQKSRFSDVQAVTPKTIAFALLILIAIAFGMLNFIIPLHFLAAAIIIGVVGVILFLYPFVGILVYQFITVIQPGIIFPSLDALHPERLMAVFLIVSLIVNIKLKRDKLIITEHRLLYLIGFFILSLIISVPTSYWTGQSVDSVIEFLKNFAYILLIVNIIKSPKRLRIFLWEYLLLIGYMALSSAIAYKTGNVVEAQGIIRAHGLAGTDPNSLSVTLGLALPFHFMLFRLEKKRYLKIISLFIVLITIYTMILTGSRSGFLGLATVVLLSWWYLPRRTIRMFALLAVTFIIIAIMPQQYQERYASIFSKERDASSEERIKVWKKGLHMFFDHPFTGVGTGAFGTANAEGYSGARKSYLKAHNLYIQTAAELGVVGLVAFFTYLGFLFAYMRKYRRYIVDKFKKKTWTWGVLMAMQISTITLLVTGMFGHSLYRFNWYFYGAITIAIGLMMKKQNLNDDVAGENVNA